MPHLKLLRRRRRGAFDLWQVWQQGGDGKWTPIGAPRGTLHEAARLARLLEFGRTVAILPVHSRPIERM
jgi:hypothetical protein